MSLISDEQMQRILGNSKNRIHGKQAYIVTHLQVGPDEAVQQFKIEQNSVGVYEEDVPVERTSVREP